MYTGANAFADTLEHCQVTHVFGYPGESTLPIYSAIQQTKISHIMAGTELSAGYMADAYARTTNKVGICDAPGGIGSPMLLPAAHECYNSSIPVVFVITSTAFRRRERWATSQCDTRSMFSSTVKAHFSIEVPDRIGELTARAITVAASGRPGPVLLEIEEDLLQKEAIVQKVSMSAGTDFPRVRYRPAASEVERASRLLLHARRPLIVAGGGVILSKAEDAIQLLTSKLGIPVATTLNGKGAISERSPLSVGTIGSKGSPVANQIAHKSDLIVWVGSKAGDKSTNYGQIPKKGTQIIQVDIDPEELGRVLPATCQICADAREALHDLCSWFEAPPQGLETNWAACEQDSGVFNPSEREMSISTSQMIISIADVFDGTALVVADASRASSWVGAFYQPKMLGRSVLAPRGSGSIGYALPATIAAAMVNSDRQVIGIGGDGGFLMSCEELECARRYGVPLIFIVLNNNSLGLLNQVADKRWGSPNLIERFGNPDWESICRGFGCEAITVRSNEEFTGALRSFKRTSSRPLIMNALISEDEVSPDFQMSSHDEGDR